MPIRWSSLHAALGSEPTDLTYAMVEAAVEQGLAENDHLDWKQKVAGDHDELAKDIAALANARGGLLIYGVGERDGRASSIFGVEVGDGVERQIRSVAATRVEPLITGLEVVSLRAGAGDKGVLAVLVPESPMLPHLVGVPEKRLGAPYRFGTQTLWWRERDLERAYADRFGRQRSDASRLQELIDEVTHQVSDEEAAWGVCVAVPQTRLLLGQRQHRDAMRAQVQDGLRLGLRVAHARGVDRWPVMDTRHNGVLNPRVGLRRWVMADGEQERATGASASYHLEVHDDGAVAFGARLTESPRDLAPDKHAVVGPLVTGLCAEFVGLLEGNARRLGVVLPFLCRFDIYRTVEKPLAWVETESLGDSRTGQPRQPGWSPDVRRFSPIDTMYEPSRDIDVLRRGAQELVALVASQFRIEDIRWPVTEG